PDDLDRTADIEGTYTLVDTSFTNRLQTNPTIAGLLASGGAGALLSDPAIAGLLNNPGLPALIANPGILTLLADPVVLAPLANPAVAGLLSNGDAMAALSDPSVLAAFSDQAALLALAASNPTIAAILSDPANLAVLGDPAFAALLSSGVVATLAATPELLGLVTDPSLGAVLSNPVVSALLADPAALALILDPRTQNILANPADLPTVNIPVRFHRTRVATGTDGDTLFLNEKVTTTNLADGTDLGLLDPRFAPTDLTLAVDRKTKLYLPELMEEADRRTDLWGLPFYARKDTVYSTWIAVAGQALPAAFVEEDATDGLATWRYVIDADDVPLGVSDPAEAGGLPWVFDTVTDVWVEPDTGAAVDAIVRDTVSAIGPDGTKYVRFANDFAFTGATVIDLVEEAKDGKDRLNLYGTTLPLGSDIVGVIMLAIAGGLVLRLRTRPTAEPATVPVEDAAPAAPVEEEA
ncbi:MAG: porin PorA family protein, partial [Chloroflexi bacterium]|nr:porin PorA family protein [Chloroflexota bacterium]